MERNVNESRRQFVKAMGLGAAGVALGISGTASAQETRPAEQGIPSVPFGKTGLQVPVICFGAMGIRANNVNVLRAGVQRGLVMIDTARGYGNGESERLVGEVANSVGRDKVIVHTKASGFPANNLSSMSDEQAYEELKKLVEDSLQRMGLDYIDTYVAPHGASNPAQVDAPQLRAAVEKLKAEGKIRFFGVSTHSDYAACSMAAINSGWHDFIMPSMGIANLDQELLSQAPDSAGGEAAAYEQKAGAPQRGRPRRNTSEDLSAVLAAAREKNVGVLAMKALQFVPQPLRPAVRAKYAPEGVEMTDEQICYRAVMVQPGVSTVTIGMQTMKHLEEALALPGIQLKA